MPNVTETYGVMGFIDEQGNQNVHYPITNAELTRYDNESSGLRSDDVQGAIDELAEAVSGKAARSKYVPITLTAAGWSNGQQTVAVAGVLADETKQLIQPVPALASQSEYDSCGVKATAQAANSLTFSATETPTSDLTVYVVIAEVEAAS